LSQPFLQQSGEYYTPFHPIVNKNRWYPAKLPEGGLPHPTATGGAAGGKCLQGLPLKENRCPHRDSGFVMQEKPGSALAELQGLGATPAKHPVISSLST